MVITELSAAGSTLALPASFPPRITSTLASRFYLAPRSHPAASTHSADPRSSSSCLPLPASSAIVSFISQQQPTATRRSDRMGIAVAAVPPSLPLLMLTHFMYSLFLSLFPPSHVSVCFSSPLFPSLFSSA